MLAPIAEKCRLADDKEEDSAVFLESSTATRPGNDNDAVAGISCSPIIFEIPNSRGIGDFFLVCKKDVRVDASLATALPTASPTTLPTASPTTLTTALRTASPLAPVLEDKDKAKDNDSPTLTTPPAFLPSWSCSSFHTASSRR